MIKTLHGRKLKNDQFQDRCREMSLTGHRGHRHLIRHLLTTHSASSNNVCSERVVKSHQLSPNPSLQTLQDASLVCHWIDCVRSPWHVGEYHPRGQNTVARLVICRRCTNTCTCMHADSDRVLHEELQKHLLRPRWCLQRPLGSGEDSAPLSNALVHVHGGWVLRCVEVYSRKSPC